MLRPVTRQTLSSLRCIAKHSTAAGTTIDQPEITKFGGHGRKWWKESSEMRLLLSMNKLRVPFIRDGLVNTGVANRNYLGTDKPLTGVKILDIGCGGGYLAESLARIGAETTGIDGSKELIDVAIEHRDMDAEIKNNLKYVHSSVEEFSAANAGAFDAIVASEVIEHVTNKEEFVKHSTACVKPGGSIFMTTMSQTPIAHLLGICMAENVLRIVPPGTHHYEKFICPHKLQRLLEEHDCYTRRIHGFTLNPLTETWYWVPFTDINYALHAVKPNKAPK